jgi:diguanylate cyclase (GGDEF)-like protein
LIMLDVDHFKRFNDAHGHAAGDSLLRELGHLLQSRTRQEDIACRYGGEEFLLILPETPLEVAIRRAESLREESRRLKVPPITDHEAITLSLGIATYPRDGASVHELLKFVDRQLYRAKKSGRDCVASASNELEEHVPSLSSE